MTACFLAWMMVDCRARFTRSQGQGFCHRECQCTALLVRKIAPYIACAVRNIGHPTFILPIRGGNFIDWVGCVSTHRTFGAKNRTLHSLRCPQHRSPHLYPPHPGRKFYRLSRVRVNAPHFWCEKSHPT